MKKQKRINVILKCIACGWQSKGNVVVQANRETGPRCPICNFKLDYVKPEKAKLWVFNSSD